MLYKDKKIFFWLVCIICIGVIAFGVMNFSKIKLYQRFLISDNLPSSQKQLILFYSSQCPHCTQVRKYLADNNLVQKKNFQEKEISVDPKNRQIFISVLQKCYKGKKDLEVNLPVLWNGEYCSQGVDEVMKEIIKN